MGYEQSGEGAVPSMPNALPVGVLPAALPGQRSALRVLDILDQVMRHMQQLERHKAAATAQVGAQGGTQRGATLPQASAPEPAALEALKAENHALKQRQQAAVSRLQALLQRVEAAEAQDAPQPETEQPETGAAA